MKAPASNIAGGLRVVINDDHCVLFHGDSKAIPLPEHSVDSIVCDPPAGIGFMGKAWDGDKGGRRQWSAWLTETLATSYAALKPGGHALVWAIPRTSHWTMCALEDLGFEIRDVVSHLFGTGFPKSLNISKAIDKTGADSGAWSGFGTALKPAAEFWILCRKPLSEKTIAANVLRWGTGALNIDGCRIEGWKRQVTQGINSNPTSFAVAKKRQLSGDSNEGRWPANVVLDEAAAAVLDAQSGPSKSGTQTKPKGSGGIWSTDKGAAPAGPQYGDRGGASRFFYVAKPSRREKDAGLDHLDQKSGGEATGRVDGTAALKSPRTGAGRTGGARNSHPTVKSIALMSWLIRLVTPPGGIVLDPFAGSGTTGCAALAEGFRFVGCELTDEYIPITEGRLRDALSNRP